MTIIVQVNLRRMKASTSELYDFTKDTVADGGTLIAGIQEPYATAKENRLTILPDQGLIYSRRVDVRPRAALYVAPGLNVVP